MEDWEDSDQDFIFNFEKNEISEEEEESVSFEDETQKKFTLNKIDPEFDFCTKPDYATLYCTGSSGVGKNSKAAVSCTILNHMGVIVCDGGKYIGDRVSSEQLSIESIIFGLEKARYNHFNKVVIYTDYKIPSTQQINSYTYKSLKYEWDLKLLIDKFEEYTINNIPKKLNIVTIRLAEKAIENQKKSQKIIIKNNKISKLNDVAFKNRFKAS